MRNFKRAMFALAVVGTLLASNMASFADQIGYVDAGKVITSYPKAQQVNADKKTKEEELQKLRATAINEIKSAKTDADKKIIEEKYNKTLIEKQKIYNQEYTKQWEPVQKEIVDTITSVAKSKKVDVVFKKEDIIVGGTDLTDAVITALTAKK